MSYEIIDWRDHTLPIAKEPGIYANVPAEEYHADLSAVSASAMKDLAENGVVRFHHDRVNGRSKQTKPLEIGEATHALILEPQSFNDRFIIDRTGERSNSNAWKAWYAEFGRGRVPIKAQDAEYMLRAVESIYASPYDPNGAKLLSHGYPELSLWWIDPETRKRCRARLDYYNQAIAVIPDVKSCRSSSLRGFSRAIDLYRYDGSAAWYCVGAEECGLKVDKFTWIAIEKEAPFDYQIHELSAGHFDDGWRWCEQVLHYWCQVESNDWKPLHRKILRPTRTAPRPVYIRDLED